MHFLFWRNNEALVIRSAARAPRYSFRRKCLFTSEEIRLLLPGERQHCPIASLFLQRKQSFFSEEIMRRWNIFIWRIQVTRLAVVSRLLAPQLFRKKWVFFFERNSVALDFSRIRSWCWDCWGETSAGRVVSSDARQHVLIEGSKRWLIHFEEILIAGSLGNWAPLPFHSLHNPTVFFC